MNSTFLIVWTVGDLLGQSTTLSAIVHAPDITHIPDVVQQRATLILQNPDLGPEVLKKDRDYLFTNVPTMGITNLLQVMERK